MNPITSAVLAAWFAAWAGRSTPDHTIIAAALAGQTENEGEARWAAAISIKESSARVHIWGDHHKSACFMQIYLGGIEDPAARERRGQFLIDHPEECARVGLAYMRASMAKCSPGDELGLYATGRCGTKYGRWVSATRMALARSFVVPELQPALEPEVGDTGAAEQ
jgi:hypothetical protein